jgi:excisionase family DNA binding protein
MAVSRLHGGPHLTVEQLAERLNKTKWWIYENRKLVGLRAIHVGKQLRFRVEDVEEWEAANMD